MPHQSFFISKLVFFDSLLLMICYTVIQVSARLERRYTAAPLLPTIPNEPEAILVTVAISGTNPAITALTNAFTVTIGGAITSSEPGSLSFSTSTSVSHSLTSDNIEGTQSASTVAGITTSQATSTITLSTSQVTRTTAAIQPTSTTPAETITTSNSSPSFVVSQGTSNLQTFTGALGNISAPQVFNIGNGQFSVEGNSVFNSEKNALSRSCAVQHNDCGDAANADHDGSFTVNDCDTQEAQCNSVAGGS